MTSPAQDIKTLLDGESSLGLTYGTDLFIGEMPETPNTCVCVRDYAGQPPDPNDYFYARVQVIVRGELYGYLNSYELARSIQVLLQEYTGTPTGADFYYTLIWALHDPGYLGEDEQHRPLFSINFRIQRR